MYVSIEDVPVGDVERKGALIDLDLTAFVPDGYKIDATPDVVESIDAAQKKGVVILPDTSRTLSLIHTPLAVLGITSGYASLDNGASIYNIKTGTYEERRWLPAGVLRDTLATISCHLCGVSCRPNPDIYEWEERPQEIDLRSLADTPSLFAEFCNEGDTADQIEDYLRLMQDAGALNYHMTSSSIRRVGSLQVYAAGVSKKLGAERLMHYAGIRPEEAIAVGDDYESDGPLLEAVKPDGLAIAMGNASEDLKHLAGVVTDDVRHDGLAKVIDRFILRRQHATPHAL